jgi:hypothetical protein
LQDTGVEYTNVLPPENGGKQQSTGLLH